MNMNRMILSQSLRGSSILHVGRSMVARFVAFANDRWSGSLRVLALTSSRAARRLVVFDDVDDIHMLMSGAGFLSLPGRRLLAGAQSSKPTQFQNSNVEAAPSTPFDFSRYLNACSYFFAWFRFRFRLLRRGNLVNSMSRFILIA